MLERSTRFGLGNFAHGVRIQSLPEPSILHYSSVLERSTKYDQENLIQSVLERSTKYDQENLTQSVLERSTKYDQENLTQSVLERSTRFDRENYFILINHLHENNILTIIITIIINNFRINKNSQAFFSLIYTYILLNKLADTLFYQFLIPNQYLLHEYKCNDFFL